MVTQQAAVLRECKSQSWSRDRGRGRDMWVGGCAFRFTRVMGDVDKERGESRKGAVDWVFWVSADPARGLELGAWCLELAGRHRCCCCCCCSRCLVAVGAPPLGCHQPSWRLRLASRLSRTQEEMGLVSDTVGEGRARGRSDMWMRLRGCTQRARGRLGRLAMEQAAERQIAAQKDSKTQKTWHRGDNAQCTERPQRTDQRGQQTGERTLANRRQKLAGKSRQASKQGRHAGTQRLAGCDLSGRAAGAVNCRPAAQQLDMGGVNRRCSTGACMY